MSAPATHSTHAASQDRDPIDVSIAICTWNRAELLERTLESFTCLQGPDGIRWEVVVVNNNCTDSTDEVVQRFQTRLPVRLVHETQQGHSFSRNAAIAAANGELLIWTDDDVRVDADWLSHFWKAFQSDRSASFWGGTVAPDFEITPPRWVKANWEICSRIYALREFGGEPQPMSDQNLPFGANFAIRTAVQREYSFNTDFGRKGSGMRGYDEIDVFRRLLADGHQGRWCPQARVEHFIPKDRLTLDYVRRYFRGQGETLAIRGNCALTPPQLRGVIRQKRTSFLLRRPFSPALWLPRLIEASRLEGQLNALEQGLATPATAPGAAS